MIADREVYHLKDQSPGHIRLEVVDLGIRKEYTLVSGITLLAMDEKDFKSVTDLLMQYDRRYVRRMKSFLPWGMTVLLSISLVFSFLS